MRSSTIRKHRCGLSQKTLYRSVNENARRKGQACASYDPYARTYAIGLETAMIRQMRVSICRFRFVTRMRLFHQFALKRFVFAIQNRRGLFIKLPLFVFADDAFFFYHSFKTFDRFFKVFGIIDCNSRHLFRPLLTGIPSKVCTIAYNAPVLQEHGVNHGNQFSMCNC